MALIPIWVRARQLADPVSEGPRGSEERTVYMVGAGFVGPTSDARYVGARGCHHPQAKGWGGSMEPRATWQVCLARTGAQSREDLVFPPAGRLRHPAGRQMARECG